MSIQLLPRAPEMESVSQRIAKLKEQLSHAAATKRMVVAHAKRLGTASDTQMLRDQVNGMLTKLKQHLEQGAEAATVASKAVLEDFTGPEPQKSRFVTNVQQMERQLMGIANEYPALVRSIAAKQQQDAPRPPAKRRSSRHEETPLLGINGAPGEAEPSESSQPRQLQQQEEKIDVSQLEVQQLGQDIRERDKEIHELVGSAVEIQQVAADIACLIDHQSAAVDQVAVHIENVSHNVDMGTEAVARARQRQRRFKIDCCGWALIALGTGMGLYVGLGLL